MAYVTIPKDLTKVKSKVLFGLTKRQLICFGAAALIGVPLFFLLRRTASNSAAAFCMIIVMLPFFLLAMYERHGQPLEVVAGQVIRCMFLRTKERPYQTNNFYAALERQAQAERPANESQVGISRFQVRKKATRSQTAERSKIETAVGQRGVQYEIRSAPVCLDKQLPRRSRYAGTCWQKPSCRPCKAFLRNAFCP